MMMPAAAKTFDEYAQQAAIPYVSSQLRSVSRVDLVWDTYKDDSLKGTARAKRGMGIRIRVVGKTAVAGSWQNFLRADSNKTTLFSFLFKIILQAFCKEDKEVVLIEGKGVLGAQQLQDIHILAPCIHEEAVRCMLLHVSHAAQHGHRQMLICTVDTDVVVSAVFAKKHLPAGCELCLAFGTGKSFRYLAALQIAASLGHICRVPYQRSMFWMAATLYLAFLDMDRRQHRQHGSYCRKWQMHYWCLQMNQTRSPMMQWT